MRTVRWLDDKLMRSKGKEETNDDDLCAAWVAAGYCEYVDAAPESEPEQGSAKAVDAPPVNRSMRGKGTRR